MILNTYHTPFWIVQSLSNDAYSNCIWIFSASFFPGNWPIMKRHCSSLRFGRPANQLVFQCRSPGTPPKIRKNKLHSTLTECLSGLVVSTHFKEKQIKWIFQSQVSGREKWTKKCLKKLMMKGIPPSCKKTSWNNIPGFLAFSWICLFCAWKTLQTKFRWLFMVMNFHGGIRRESHEKQIQYLQLWWDLRLPNTTLLVQSPNGTDAVLLGDELLQASEAENRCRGVFFLVPEKEKCVFSLHNLNGEEGGNRNSHSEELFLLLFGSKVSKNGYANLHYFYVMTGEGLANFQWCTLANGSFLKIHAPKPSTWTHAIPKGKGCLPTAVFEV